MILNCDKVSFLNDYLTKFVHYHLFSSRLSLTYFQILLSVFTICFLFRTSKLLSLVHFNLHMKNGYFNLIRCFNYFIEILSHVCDIINTVLALFRCFTFLTFQLDAFHKNIHFGKLYLEKLETEANFLNLRELYFTFKVIRSYLFLLLCFNKSVSVLQRGALCIIRCF